MLGDPGFFHLGALPSLTVVFQVAGLISFESMSRERAWRIMHQRLLGSKNNPLVGPQAVCVPRGGERRSDEELDSLCGTSPLLAFSDHRLLILSY